MCAQFLLKAAVEKIMRRFGTTEVPSSFFEAGPWPERVLPFAKAPVIVEREGTRRLQLMQFSLLPRWSKDRKVKFATHNARLDGIDSKPTWKIPLQKHRCLVPIESFVEPIYAGEYAGNMVAFTGAEPDTILAAAGIWDEWVSPDGEVVESFSIITDDPIPFVEKIGHDRSPLFLGDHAFDPWLKEGDRPATELKEFLRAHREEPRLAVSIDRPLKQRRKIAISAGAGLGGVAPAADSNDPNDTDDGPQLKLFSK